MPSAIRCITIILLLFIHSACAEKSPVVAKKKVDPIQRTFNSLRKVDNHPLFTMWFYADYDFDSRLSERNQAGRKPAECESPAVKWACTCFSALAPGADAIMGRNFDWYDHPALLLFTDPADAYASASMIDISYLGYNSEADLEGNLEPLLQTPYMPFDGLNECGLAIGMMAVSSANLAHDPNKITLTCLEIIRLVLDYAATVDQAVNLIGQYNIDFTGGPPLHYLVADASGSSAVVEFIDGQISVLESNEAWQVSTNFLLTGHTIESARSACWRYRLSYDTLSGRQGAMTAEITMQLLQSVSQQNTRWSLMYNLSNGSIQVAMGKKYGQILDFFLN
jgi:hypothetical protein